MQKRSAKGARVESRTFAYVVERLLAVKKHTLSPTAYENTHRIFHKHLLPFFGNKMVCDITENDAYEYFSTKLPMKMGDHLKNIKSVLRYSFNEGWAHRLIQIRNPDPAPSAGRLVTKKEFRYILSHLSKSDDFYFFLLMMWHLGMRPAEVTKCRCEFIDLNQGIITLPAWFLKTRRMADRVVPLTNELWKLMKKRISKGQVFLFPAPNNPGKHRYDFKVRWKRLKRKLKLEKSFRLYDLRHSAITHLIMAQVNPLEIRQICGVSPQVMKRYTHVPVKDMRKSLERALKKAA